jgi:hypothetical protein
MEAPFEGAEYIGKRGKTHLVPGMDTLAIRTLEKQTS